MIKKLTILTATMFACFGVFSQQAIAQQVDASPIEQIENIVTPYNLTISQDGNNAIFSWNHGPIFFDDIESYDDFIFENIGDYILVDVDSSPTYGFGYGISFSNEGYTGSYIVINTLATTPPLSEEDWAAHSGNKFLGCFAAMSHNNNDWLVTPEVTVIPGMEFSFWARTSNYIYGYENFRVGISTGGTTPSDFTIISEGTHVNAPHTWTKFTYPLDEYVGQNIRAAINYIFYGHVFMVDDIYIGVPEKEKSRAFNGYTVYLDGEEVASGIMEETYTFQNVPVGEHTAGVKAVYTSGESEVVEIAFDHEPKFNVKFIAQRYIYGSPVKGVNIIVSNESITESKTTDINGIATFELPRGHYNWVATKLGFEDWEGTVVVTDHTEIIIIYKSIESETKVQGIKLYPNPATNTLTITRENTNNAMVEIYSNNGVIVNSFEMSETVKEISVSELNSGVYFIRVIEKEATKVQKFIKQ